MAGPVVQEHPTRPHPRVVIVGGCDVQNRIDLLRAIAGEFSVAALGSDSAQTESFARAGIPFYHFRLERGNRPLSDLRSVVELRRLFALLRPDVVHAFATKPSVWGRLAARSEGVPVVIGTLPGLGSLYASDGLRNAAIRSVYERLQRAACRASDLTIFQNERDAEEFTAAGISPLDRTVVISGSGVRTDLFDRDRVARPAVDRVRAEIGAGDGAVVVTMISRIIRSKGVLEFAEAADSFRARRADVRFVLVGPNDRESLDRLTPAELDRVAHSTVWLGERRDITAILAASDLFVLPSFYREGIPRALLEAAAMELPLVATRTPGCEDVVRDGANGLLVEPRDTAALTRAIDTLVARPELRDRFGRAARALAVERFDLALIARQTAAIYRRLLGDKHYAAPRRWHTGARGAATRPTPAPPRVLVDAD